MTGHNRTSSALSSVAERWVWLAGLFVTAIYLCFEIRFNTRLIDFVGIATPDSDVAETLEIEGRRLAAIGAAILVVNFYAGFAVKRAVKQGTSRSRLTLTVAMIIGIALATAAYQGMYRFQEWLVNTVVESSSPADLRNATLLQLMRIGILNGVIHDPQFPYNGDLIGKINLAQLYLVLTMDRNTVEQVAGTADEAIYRIVSCRNYKESYSSLHSGYFAFLDGYSRYNQASRRYFEARRDISHDLLQQHEKMIRRIEQATRTKDRALQKSRFNSARGRAFAEREFPDSRHLPNPWDLGVVSMSDALRPIYEKRLEDDFRRRLSDSFGCPLRLPPGLELAPFWGSQDVQSCLKKRLSLSREVKLAKNDEEFWRRVWRPWNDNIVDDVIAEYGQFSREAFDASLGDHIARRNGVDAIKLVTFVPIAILFSCFFAYSNFLNFLYNIFNPGLCYTFISGYKNAKAGLFMFLMLALALFVTIFTEPVESKATELYTKHISEDTFLTGHEYKFFVRMQMLLYEVGSSLTERSGYESYRVPDRCVPKKGESD